MYLKIYVNFLSASISFHIPVYFYIVVTPDICLQTSAHLTMKWTSIMQYLQKLDNLILRNI